METSLYRALTDKAYERRKTAALEVEKLVRTTAATDDAPKLTLIIHQLCELARNQHSNTRSGGIMGLAAASIALGPRIAAFLVDIVPPILACFNDTDSKVRYFACESMYNVAKVAKGEILIFFNELFDSMSKLAADTELPVKNGAELLDRLIKDIVTEQASTYVSTVLPRSQPSSPRPSTSAFTTDPHDQQKAEQHERAFSLARFIPLLRERIYVLNPFTRTYLVSWLTVLDSVPELELVSFLPEFLDGLLKFLGDPTVDIRTATQNLLEDFLREVREVAEVGRIGRRESMQDERPGSLIEMERGSSESGAEQDEAEEEEEMENDLEGSGEWIAGQGVEIDHAAIIEILLEHSSFPDEEIQSTCLRWLAEFLLFVQPTMVPFAARLIPVILSSLAHHVVSIRTAANETNYNLYKVIQELPTPLSSFPPVLPPTPIISQTVQQGKQTERERTRTVSPTLSGTPTFASIGQVKSPNLANPATKQDAASAGKGESGMASLTTQLETTGFAPSARSPSFATSPLPVDGERYETEAFDYGATVNALTLQFLNEHEETRVAALEWLLMLHQKAPKKVLAVEDLYGSTARNDYSSSESGLSIALLLKMLSDSSEKVLRYDLRLLAQISSNSPQDLFPNFMLNLLSLFSTDRKLLETRGSLIIRQLCVSLNTERIYTTFAEILEKDEDLEFASIMVQNLNLIMITSPELASFRKRLKTLESKDGQNLFTILYRSWSHNAVATFSLCLLAQAYEQASALLQIFTDLEITVSLLIQIDKLVQLLESPVFTSLRLQLLEPEKYPFLLKAMYGLLMLLPQSSAFATLRNRLSAVSSLGFLQTVPKATYSSTTARPTPRREEIRWTELLAFFRTTQMRQERGRRAGAAAQTLGFDARDNAPVVGRSPTPVRSTSAAAQSLRSKIPAGTRYSSAGSTTTRSTSAVKVGSVPSMLERRLGNKS